MDLRRIATRLPQRQSSTDGIVARLRELRGRYHRHLLQDEFGPTRAERAQALKERAETEADLMALELLAPADAVVNSCWRYKGQVDETIALDVLENEYGLPPWAAKLQARVVVRRYGSRRSAWLDGLGKLARNQSPG